MSSACPTCQGLLLQIEMHDPIIDSNHPTANSKKNAKPKRTCSITQLYKRLAMCDVCSEKLYNVDKDQEAQRGFIRPNRARLTSLPVLGLLKAPSSEFVRIRKTSASQAVLSS